MENGSNEQVVPQKSMENCEALSNKIAQLHTEVERLTKKLKDVNENHSKGLQDLENCITKLAGKTLI